MAKITPLTARTAAALIKEANRAGDYRKRRLAEGLWLVPQRRAEDVRWFVLLRWRQNGSKEKVKSLGTYDPAKHEHYLAELARAREALREGLNPHNALGKTGLSAAGTFKATAEAYIADRVDTRVAAGGSIKNASATKSCIRKRYKALGHLPLTAITTDDLKRAVGADRPGGFWFKRLPASRLALNRIAWVIDYGFAKSEINLANPADWRRLKLIMPRRKHHETKSHRSVAPVDVPAAFRELAATKRAGYRGWAPLALRFAILTGSRGNEVMKMRWDDINWRTKSWDRSAAQMKTGRGHRVPLSAAALAMLHELEPFRRGNPFVFQGQKLNTGLTHNSLRNAMQSTSFGELATPHGFRTSFYDWWRKGVGWNHQFPEKLVDLCLAHWEKNKVRAAYQKDDLLEERRVLMERWARFVTGTEEGRLALVA